MARLGDEFNLTEEDLAQIDEIYAQSEKDIEELIQENIDKNLTVQRKEQLFTRLATILAATSVATKQYLATVIPESYRVGLRTADRDLKKTGSPIGEDHIDAVNELISDGSNRYDIALTTVQRDVQSILDEATARQIQARISTVTTESIDEIAKDIEARIRESGITGIVDRNGRRLNMKAYARMVARTDIISAANQGVINRSLEFGVDIVQVSEHAGVDPRDELCFTLQGKIFSLTGRSENYPQLPAIPPFHPNCRHTLEPRPDLS